MKNESLLRGTYLLALAAVIVEFAQSGVINGNFAYAAIVAGLVGVVYGVDGFFGGAEKKKPEGKHPNDGNGDE